MKRERASSRNDLTKPIVDLMSNLVDIDTDTLILVVLLFS